MTPKEFQEKYNFTDEDISLIRERCLLFNGKITKISDILTQAKKG